MAGLGDLFGQGTIGEQLLVWGVLNQLFGAGISPALTDIQQSVNSFDPNVALTPQQLAVAVVRGIVADADGASEAAKSGIGPGRFAQLQQLALQPASLDYVIAAYQRSMGSGGEGGGDLIDVDTALADLGISESYRPAIKALAIQIPSAQQVYLAWLQGQITADEAQQRLLATGLDPTWIQTGYDAQGEAPTPVQALEMLNRGLIPLEGTGPGVVSYLQAFLEGPWRNKWEPAFLGLRYYLPPPRTITALVKEGALTQAQATQYLQAQGLDPTLTAIYLDAASHSTTAAQRELTQAEIVDSYASQLLTHDEALADLVALRFTNADAELLLSLSDKKTAVASTKQAITRIRTLFLNGDDSAATTRNALASLGLQGDQVSNLIATWQLEQATVVRTLSAAEIAGAFFYGVFTQATATAKLVAMGYSTSDAQVVLAVRQHGLLTGQAIS